MATYLKHEVQQQQKIRVRYGGLEFDRLDQLEHDRSSEEVLVSVSGEATVTEIT